MRNRGTTFRFFSDNKNKVNLVSSVSTAPTCDVYWRRMFYCQHRERSRINTERGLQQTQTGLITVRGSGPIQTDRNRKLIASRSKLAMFTCHLLFLELRHIWRATCQDGEKIFGMNQKLQFITFDRPDTPLQNRTAFKCAESKIAQHHQIPIDPAQKLESKSKEQSRS